MDSRIAYVSYLGLINNIEKIHTLGYIGSKKISDGLVGREEGRWISDPVFCFSYYRLIALSRLTFSSLGDILLTW